MVGLTITGKVYKRHFDGSTNAEKLLIGLRHLVHKGEITLPYPFPFDIKKFPDWLKSQAGQINSKPTQLGLF